MTVWNRWSARCVPAALTALIVAGIAGWAISAEGGETPYPLDDTFIHLAMAQNLALGHWGVASHAFSNASSSPLYVVLLAALGGIGLPWVWLPLILNLLAGSGLLLVTALVLERESIPVQARWFCAGALVLLLPLPYLIILGMEHTLHCAVIVAFLAAAIHCLQGGSGFAALAIAPFLIMIRLESGFLIAVACLCFLGIKRYREALLLAALTSAPVAALGILGKANGEFFLPNPVLLKAGVASGPIWTLPMYYLSKMALQLYTAPSLFFLTAVLIYCAGRALESTKDRRNSGVLWPLAAVLAILGHATFASAGWLFRYEMYLVALGIVALAICAPKAKAWVLLFAILPCAYRAANCGIALPGAILGLNTQQVQMAHLIHDHYDGESVALDDIGVVAFYTDARLLDLAGLASREILAKRLDGTLSTLDLDRIASMEGTKIAVVYDSWFQGGDVRQFGVGPKLPAAWVKVGEWRSQEATITGGDVLSFYATSPVYMDKLRVALMSYAPRLSSRIQLHLTPQSISSVGVPAQGAQ